MRVILKPGTEAPAAVGALLAITQWLADDPQLFCTHNQTEKGT